MQALRRIEEILPLTAWFALRERIAASRSPERKAQFEAIRAKRQRERLFVVGTAPSLAKIDLDRLDGEDYFLVNMAEHLDWAKGRTHPYYLAADTGVAEKFANGRPGLDARHYFLAAKLEPRLDPQFVAEKKPFFYHPAKGGVRKRGLVGKPWISVAPGQTILLTAVQIGWALGYREIYVLGCDLDYGGAKPYAYRTGEAERKRAERDDTQMHKKTNEQFAILRRAIERQGGTLANAGVGGRLETLPRVPFDTLFQS